MRRPDDAHRPFWHDAAEDPRAVYEHHPVDDMEPLPERDCTACGEHHLKLLIWLSAPYARGKGRSRKMHQRAAVYLWHLTPHLLPWRTVEELARGIGLSRQHVQALLQDLRAARRNPTSAA